MVINNGILQELYDDAGKIKKLEAQKCKDSGKVKFVKIKYKDKNNFSINANITEDKLYKTYIDVRNGKIEELECNCPDYYNLFGVCKHSLATIIAFSEENIQNIEYEKNITINSFDKNKYIGFKQIVKTIYNEELEEINSDIEDNQIKKDGNIKIEPYITFDKFTKILKVEFKIGDKHMYKIKNLSEFYDRIMSKSYFKYGEKLQFIHKKENFEKDSQELLEFLMKYAEIIKYTNSNVYANYAYYGNPLNETYIVLNNTSIDELFNILKGKKVKFQNNCNSIEVEFLDENPQLQFELEKNTENNYKIVPKFHIYELNVIKGKEYTYILQNEKFYKCTKKFENENLKLLKLFRDNYLEQVEFGKEELNELFSVIIPKVKDAIVMKEDVKEELQQYIPEKLLVKLFLDFDKNNYVVSNVKFCYGENEFNPLDEKEEKLFKYPRNIVEETKALNIFKKTGFMYEKENKRFILPDNDKIYKFITEDIEIYMQKFEVMATDNFKSKEIIKPKIVSLGVKVENDLLSVNLSQLNIDSAELEEIMAKYRLKKKYHRLKSGAFLELTENEEISFLDKLISGTNISYKQLESGNVQLPINRTLYLNQLLKSIKGTEIEENKEYRDIVNNFNKDLLEEGQIPDKLKKVLRPYQKIGFKWLQMLDSYGFGGILADDMGLGKTIQIISILLKAKENEKGRTSLVISPSSLVLNWKNEVEKFAPELKMVVIRGNAKERKAIIDEIEKYDIVVTSYDLLKKDIEFYNTKKYKFKYVIADEAQYLKNNNTQNAKAIKQIVADTRFALTGTPIENSLAELWSIFDFIMPGYLFSYNKFKSTYETKIIKENDEETIKKLKMLIEPFVLRRTKKEVLTELPEKTVTILNNEMGEEQKDIYISYLLRAKQELNEGIDINGYERNQIKILAALTRLRQICCHPGLFIDNYKNTSSKLEQCIEIIEDGITAGHKILLFSSYTSMFEIIEKELAKKHIKYFKLTGSTKVDDRVELVDEFNRNQEIKVFLISLKAGGTGLNLTGADMVIHYDPWWNISAENQATDRAYRIGQKNNVQVYKLITKDSIEEKIYELQKKKFELTENMLDTNTTFINKLSKDDIMNLFN